MSSHSFQHSINRPYLSQCGPLLLRSRLWSINALDWGPSRIHLSINLCYQLLESFTFSSFKREKSICLGVSASSRSSVPLERCGFVREAAQPIINSPKTGRAGQRTKYAHIIVASMCTCFRDKDDVQPCGCGTSEAWLS
jgi:hypothetical protein